MLVVIGIITRNRNTFLRECLDSIAAQQIPNHCDIHIVLVDNNEDQSAKVVYDEKPLPFESSYIHETKKGIVHARNKVIETSLGLNANILGFIDDRRNVIYRAPLQLHNPIIA